MILHGPLSIISLVVMLFSKALVVVATVSDGDHHAIFNWRTNEELLGAHKGSILKHLTFAIVTFRIGTCMMKRSFMTFLLFAIMVIRFLIILIRLAKMARSLQELYGPLLVAFCVVISAALFYLKLTIEVVFAAFYLLGVYRTRAPSFGDMASLVLDVFRFLQLP